MSVLVSAVITTHKREPQIVERAIRSILSQTYKNIEIFVVDDSPEDYKLRQCVEEMVGKYGTVTYIAHEKCMGACVARNTGLAAARGEYIGFLDDDDEWLPDKIEKQLAGFTSGDTALVYCGSVVLNELTGTENPRATKWYSGRVYERLIMENFIGSTSFPLIRKKCLNDINGFDPLMQSAQDYDVWLRLSKKYEVNYVDKPLVRYHVHGSDQISKGSARRIAGLERVNQKNMVYLRKNKDAYWQRLIKMAPEYARNGQIMKAVWFWLKAVTKRPLKLKSNVTYLYSILANSKHRYKDE